jgi:neutral ceramidase
MKKYPFFIAVFFIAVVLMNSANAQQSIRAGAARENITPTYGTIMNGDFLPNFAKVIHDSLYAKVLAFDNGSTRFVFVVVDNMSIDGDFINETKKKIQTEIGLKPEQVMISSTHAHSCPAVVGGGATPTALNYRLALPGQITNAVKNALANLQPAKIAWGNINVPKHVSCRRWYMKPGFPTISPLGDTDKVWMNPPLGNEFIDRPVSPPDPQVSFLAVKNMEDKWISVLANYSTHYAADIPANTISADYFGEVHNALQIRLGAGTGFVGIMSNGTSGDVNTFDFKLEKNYPQGPYQKTTLIGADIADSIVVALKRVTWETKPVFKIAFNKATVTSRRVSPELLARSEKLVVSTDYLSLNTIDKASDAIKRLYALEIVELNHYDKPVHQLPLQAIHIGQGIIGTLPGEFFSETGLNLKKQTSARYYFSIALANEEIGYVPPAGQFKLGGYETWLCRSSHLAIDAEEKIRNTLIAMIKSVK